MQLKVDTAQRFAKMRAHTATHLLHFEITKFFPHTKQAGSQVDQDQLRFDFQADRLLSYDELLVIEDAINQHIYSADLVKIEELSKQEAQTKGAKAFFEDKYGDVVRVVSIYDHDNNPYSIEFCGGTHVSNTSNIGAFSIIGHEAVASGIKRIIAITGPKVFNELKNIRGEYNNQAKKLGISRKQFPQKLDKILQELEEKDTKLQHIIMESVHKIVESAYKQASQNQYFEKIITLGTEGDSIKLKELIPIAKTLGNSTLCIVKSDNSYLIVSAQGNAKNIAQKLELKGGGSEDIRQGKDPKITNFIKI